MFRLFSFLSSLFRRDGLATVGKLFRYALSPKAWRWLLSGICHKRDLKAAGLVDEAWYRREYPDVAESGIDPVQDFLTPPHPWLRLPNPDFVPREYAAVNFDVKASGLPWAVHYARDGMREGRSVSTLENYERPFPREAAEFRREFAAAPVVHRRTAVFASFSGDGRLKETVLHYLRGLREVVDNVVFVANNPVLPDEAAKLDGAGTWQQFRYITLPLLTPTTFFIFVMAVIGSFQVFDQVMLMTEGGPGRSSSVLVHYLYQNAFQYFKLGYACAIAYLLFFIIMAITIFNMRMEKKMRDVY